MRLIPAAAAVALVVVCAGAALAEDGKIHPASLCQPMNASHANRVEYTANGHACNVSATTELLLRCPIVRDTMNGSGITFFRVYAKVADPDGMDCVLRTLRPDTNVNDGFFFVRSIHFPLADNNNPDAVQYFQSFEDIPDVAYGPYELTCALPPMVNWSGVQKQNCLGAYRVDEE